MSDVKEKILAELQGFFAGKQVGFTGHSSGVISLYDMVYDGKDWFCITGRAIIDISNPSLAKVKHELTVSLQEAFDRHVNNKD